MLRIVVPKGRMNEVSLGFLFNKGLISFKSISNSRQLKVVDSKKDIEVFFVRSKDVGTYVEQGAADLGIIGYDLIMEHQYNVFIPQKLPFGKCRLSVAYLDGHDKWKSRKTIQVATTYPRLTSDFFYLKGYNVEIIELYGSIEIAPITHMADVIVDLVSTGQTLQVNNLVEDQVILKSQATLIINPQTYFSQRDLVTKAIDQLL